jgi:hypothetical protein
MNSIFISRKIRQDLQDLVDFQVFVPFQVKGRKRNTPAAAGKLPTHMCLLIA